ncbi:MAG: hypothetical protein HC765_10150 [Brachymonas sp.]|nr:hypothetical protein [Brachymonas sp.]
MGAGDSFAAALLAHLHRHQKLHVKQLAHGLPADTLQHALQHAVASAALCVQRAGCDPASWDEAAALSKRLAS